MQYEITFMRQLALARFFHQPLPVIETLKPIKQDIAERYRNLIIDQQSKRSKR